jgi:arsenate reductase
MDSITVHGLKACDSCRAARKALEAAGKDVRLRDLRADPPERGEIAAWRAALGPALVNRRSTTWRALDEATRALPEAELLAAHPTLIKRPLIEAGGALHLGWSAETRRALGLAG